MHYTNENLEMFKTFGGQTRSDKLVSDLLDARADLANALEALDDMICLAKPTINEERKRHEKAKSALANALELLRECEYAAITKHSQVSYCPVCGTHRFSVDGHEPDCRLAAALKKGADHATE